MMGLCMRRTFGELREEKRLWFWLHHNQRLVLEGSLEGNALKCNPPSPLLSKDNVFLTSTTLSVSSSGEPRAVSYHPPSCSL